MGHNTKNYMKNGGQEWVIGGKLTVEEGAEVQGLGGGSGGSDKVIVNIHSGDDGLVSDKTLAEVQAALNGRGLEALEIVYAVGDRHIPFNYQLTPKRLRAYFFYVNSNFVEGTEAYALHSYYLELSNTSGYAVTEVAEAVWANGAPETT